MAFTISPILGTSQIPVLILIDAYCHYRIPTNCVPPVMSMLVGLIDNEKYLPTLQQLLDRVENDITSYLKSNDCENGAQLVKSLVVDQLNELNDLDKFNDYLNSFGELIIDPPLNLINITTSVDPNIKKIQCNSFLGKFIIKILLSVKVMNFDEMLVIWKGFCEYRKPLLKQNTIKPMEEEKFWNQLLNQTKLGSNADPIDQVISQEDLMNLFIFQIDRIQTNSPPLPDSVNKILKNMTQLQRNGVDKSHYIEYLQYWRAGDYENSLNSLHRYFDYMMSSKQSYYYHYALLALATLHSSFGCEREAIRAINEAIMVAREARDSNCLNYLIAWLFDFLNERPHLEKEGDMTRDQILEFLELKSKERHNSSLHCISYMNKAQMALTKGLAMAEVNDNLICASYIALNSPVSVPQMINLIHVCRLTSQMWWLVGGMDPLVDVYLDIALDFSEEYHDFNERSEINIIRAQRVYESGDYEGAIKIVDEDEEKIRFNINLYKKWKVRRELIELAHLLDSNGNVNKAEIILTDICSIADELNHVDINYEINFMKSKFLIWKGDISGGAQLIMEGLSMMREANGVNNYWFLKYQLQYSKIMGNRGTSVILSAIQSGFSCGFGIIVNEGLSILNQTTGSSI